MEKTGIVFSDETIAAQFEAFGRKKIRDIDRRWNDNEEDYDDRDYDRRDEDDARDVWRPREEEEEKPRRVVRVRVPVVRTRSERQQHKYTVVRRRPLVPYSKPAPIVVASPTARRIVVTRVRSRLPANQLVPEVKYRPEVEYTQDVKYRPEVEYTQAVKYRPEVGYTQEVKYRPEVEYTPEFNYRPEVEHTPELKYRPKVEYTPELKYRPEADYTPEVKYRPEADYSPEVKYRPEVEYSPEMKYRPEVKYSPGVKYRPEVEYPPETQTLQPTSSIRHRVTVTRRRKIRPTSVVETIQRPRVTRKKLVNVRPVVQPTPTFAIITTGFYSAPSTSEEDEYEEEEDVPEDIADEDELPVEKKIEEEHPVKKVIEKGLSVEMEVPVEKVIQDGLPVEKIAEEELPIKKTTEVEELPVEDRIPESKSIPSPEKTPILQESPNDIDSKPEVDFDDSDEDEPSRFELGVPDEELPSKVDSGPVIITDHFFLPAADSDESEEYEGEDYSETTTGSDQDDATVTENPKSSMLDEDNTSEDSPEATTFRDTTEGIVTNKPNGPTGSDEKESEELAEEPAVTTTSTPLETTLEDSSTTNENDDSTTIVPKTTPKQVTIYVEEENTSLPETAHKHLTIFIEPGTINATADESSTKEIPNEEITKEEATTVRSTDTMGADLEAISSPKTDSSSDVRVEDEPTSEFPITETSPEPSTKETEASSSTEPIGPQEDDLRVVPLESYEKSLESSSKLYLSTYEIRPSSSRSALAGKTIGADAKDSFLTDEVPGVIPIEAEATPVFPNDFTDSFAASVTTSYASPTPEDIEAGLADDLYLSLSRPDFPEISPSRAIDSYDSELTTSGGVSPTPELSTSVYYTETVVTSTKLRTYTYVVTKLNGHETEVTSSTTVRPRVTTLTLNVPVTVTIYSPTAEATHESVAPVYSPVPIAEYEVKEEDEGRRFNLATRVMSNGVEVIVAGPTPALRWENSNPQPTLTLSDTVVMLMPQEEPNEFVTKTCTTTFTYLSTILKDGATIVSTDQQVVANTATEERHRKPGTESASVTLEASPTLRTEVFKTTYTYLTLNTDHPDVNNALGSSMKVITNTVTAPQHYLDMLEPSEAAQPETNTYLSTRQLEKTFMEDGRTRIETIGDTVTQLIITESAPPPPRPTSVATTLTALDNTDESMTDITKTYFITYTYFNTYLEKGSTVIHTNIATSTDVVLEKVPAKKTAVQSVAPTPTPEPIQIFATKTYLTTFTYFTTLLQAGSDGETSTTISSRSHIVENVVTESIAPSLLDAGYMNALLTTAHHSDSVKNVVTGSTIIFFDEEDQIDPTTSSSALSQSTASPEIEASDKVPESTPESSQVNPTAEASATDVGQSTGEQVAANDSDGNTTSSSEDTQNKRPSNAPANGVSNLLSLGSLGINSLSALGPVITAMAGMAGLLQGKSTATRRNDTAPPIEAQESTTQRSPIYIPVAEFADGDIETAESQNIAAQLANPNMNFIPETRHKVAASLVDGIPISPGEVITANTDVIIGKPGKLGPRPPHTKSDEHIGMSPPPIPVPNIPVHPVLEVVTDESDSQAQSSIQSHRNTQIQILPAHQVYEKHLKVPGPAVFSSNSGSSSAHKRPHQIQTGPPLRQVANKHDHLENDPLLKPPSRPNVEQYANPNINPKDSEWNRDRFRRPWSAKDPLTPPVPPRYDEIQTSEDAKPWQNNRPQVEEQKRPPWAQKDPLPAQTTVILESSESKPSASEPIIHQIPHVIDRSTGQPLLVNIQPSQVANVVIPQGGTQALIFGDTSEPHISGQYFDDPSPYPEPEVGPGFVGVEKIENNPADYMVPPAPPVNFKPLPQKPNNRDHPHTIPLSNSQSHFNIGRPQDSSEISTNTRLDKRPSEVLLIQRPDGHGQSSGQGHVHTEILVHHRPESVNLRPQIVSQNHGYADNHEPPRRDYSNKHSRPSEQSPSRVDIQTETPHRYIYLDNKPNDSVKDVKQNWKYDRKPQRPSSSGRPDRRPERPSARPHPPTSHNYPIYERPGGYPGRKPQYSSPPARPNQQASGHFSGSPNWHSQPQSSQEPPKQFTGQHRPHQSHPKEQPTRPPTDSNESKPSENLPTGAIGYYNPSTDPKVKPVDTHYYPQLATTKPEVQSFGEILPRPSNEHDVSWQIDTQTERTSADSDSEASENVHFQNAPAHHDNHGSIDKQDDEVVEVQTSSSNLRPESPDDAHPMNSYDTVGSVNTVVGKPVDIAQSMIYESQNKNPSNYDHQQKQDHNGQDHGQGSYDPRPQESPIVQGKPYGVYSGQVDHGRPYAQHHEDSSRPDYEVIQGVPFSQHGGKRPVARPYERDDTIDLKPPAIIPQFGSTPGRPFSRPHSNSRPETSRPSSRPRPDLESTNNRPVVNREPPKKPTSGSNEGPSRPGSQNAHEAAAYPRPDWSLGTQVSENTRPDHRDRFDNPEVSDDRHDAVNRTNIDSNQSSYFPTDAEDNNNNNGDEGNKKDDHPQVQVLTAGTRVHPAYPHILTKPRPRVPKPVTISSGPKKPEVNNGRPKIQFSLPVEASGEEKDSKTQTERPPSMLVTANGQKKKKQEETLETAFQTNFATAAKDNEDSSDEVKGQSSVTTEPKKQESGEGGKPKVPSQDMMPPPLRKSGGSAEQANKKNDEAGLEPPPHPSDVVGLSPPPVAITTTGRPKEDRFSFGNVDDTGLRPPPKYIPLKDSVGVVTPPRPSTSMVPPSPRPTVARPFLADLLSQDMVPPPLVFETSRPSIVVETVRPAIAVSGSIQIATAVAASHIPVMQDMDSKIPIIHGTVDLPIVMDVSDIMKQPMETKKSEHVSIYTVRPFDTRPVSRVSVQPTTIITSNLIMPTKLRPPQIDHVETVGPSISRVNSVPTRVPSYDTPRRPTKRPDYPVFLEPSRQHVQPSMEIEATESLTRHTNRVEESKFHGTQTRKYPSNDRSAQDSPTIVTRVQSSITRTVNTLIPRRDKLPKTKEFDGTVIHEVVNNGTTATVEMKPKAVTHYRTLTVTRTETSVVGSPPTTRALLLTHTLTSTIVETVTETLLRPTSVVATVTSTILQSVTRLPNSYENAVDNDSIFVVMSDQNPPSPGAEEVEAEYGEEEVSRDEQDPVGNEINRVLAGGILGAPVAPMRPPINQCQPECKASKAEVCSAGGTEARCVCRPGFARMFPDRPCKPIYTYTLRVGLERMGREPVFYEAALNDTSSTAFRRLAGPTKEALDRTMMQSDLRDVYRSLEIAGFVPNPTQVEFHVQLSDNANETRLKEVIRKYLIGNNYSLGGTEVYAARDLEMIDARDFDECSMQEGGPHHDCSQHAACFNLRGSYQCSCREGWADLSENPAYPGRVCSQAPLGCAGCNNKGHCTTNVHGHDVCECFPWHSGQRCQVNLKVLLIVLVTTGAILLGFLAVCLGLACFRHPGRRCRSGDRRAMIPGTGGDTSSEGSVTDLAIPHHVPHVLPPPPRSVAPAPPAKRPTRKITPNGKRCRSPRKASITAPVQVNEEQCDRSLTVMIPRAKYRSTPQSPQNYKPAMSTFAADEHKLISYLENGAQPGNRKPSLSSTKDYGKRYEESGIQMVRSAVTPSGALVSAGFQVSATVTRTGDVESSMARGDKAQIETSTKTMRSSDLQGDASSTLARSCGETSTSTKLLRLDFGDSSGSTMAKSCGETTIQTSTKLAPSRRSDSKDTRDARDSGSEGHMTMERDLGSTLRLTPQHPALYKPDRASDRDSNFDSL